MKPILIVNICFYTIRPEVKQQPSYINVTYFKLDDNFTLFRVHNTSVGFTNYNDKLKLINNNPYSNNILPY